jgi:hypothetical protein
MTLVNPTFDVTPYRRGRWVGDFSELDLIPDWVFYADNRKTSTVQALLDNPALAEHVKCLYDKKEAYAMRTVTEDKKHDVQFTCKAFNNFEVVLLGDVSVEVVYIFPSERVIGFALDASNENFDRDEYEKVIERRRKLLNNGSAYLWSRKRYTPQRRGLPLHVGASNVRGSVVALRGGRGRVAPAT